MKMRRLSRGSLAALTLAWAAFGLLWAATIVLPVPNLALWLIAVFVSEFSLVLAALALVEMVLAAIVWRVGFLVSSGKSERMSASLLPPARYSRMSPTVILMPLIVGLPPQQG